MARPKAHWIRLDHTVHDHPKIVSSSLLLGICREQMVGHMSRLWCWCSRYRPTGQLDELSNAMIAEASGWKGDPDRWIEVLESGRLIELHRGVKRLRGWIERNDYQNRERARKRVRTPSNPAPIPHQSRTNPAPTGQDITVQNKLLPDTSIQPSAELDPPSCRRVKPRKKPEPDEETMRFFLAFYGDYPRHEGRMEALKAFVRLNPDKDLLRTISRDIQQRIAAGKWQPDVPEQVKFIPLPASYLNGRRWEDGQFS